MEAHIFSTTNELFIPFFIFCFDDKVTKNENRLRDFLYNVFRLQGKTGKTGKTKMKNNNKKKTIIFVFRNFCQPKQKTKNGMKSSLGFWLQSRPPPCDFGLIYVFYVDCIKYSVKVEKI